MASSLDVALAWAGTITIAPSSACQAAFALLGAGVIALTLLPKATQKHLLDYGARDPKIQEATDRKNDSTARLEPDMLERFVAAVVARLQVPHGWFVSFYVFYLVAAAFWAVQWWSWEPYNDSTADSSGNLLGWIVRGQQRADVATATAAATAPQPSMALIQVYVAFGLEFLQGSRRLYEHLYVMKPSSSKMNAAQFILGLAYYAIMSVAVWVEGSQAILNATQHGVRFTITHETFAKLVIGVPLFVAASASQYWCHKHLASLVKYSLPERGLFRYLISPHYTSEVGLYFALSIIAAPEGRLINRTLLWSELFVLVSLGVTAARTKQWYSDKFGAERVAGKWKMIPFVF
ncbi:3-oxo-5-alpha-steroid 4-dehydrogenase [Ophiostoma piceae UAMH 11346]|uniref:Polyprenal reductase n=1 Tax=Ophiostoma piceae (strain UAMH 11346) TaxID=1262450 RepID=S3C3C2_OPHP1|nr:3-oxo-5-alpha-steroid 4-dehydrogenase [Ophiostoma piceae UAMH 11346]